MITVILGTTFLLLRPGSKLSPWPGRVQRIEERTRAIAQLRETEIYYNNLANTLYREATPMLSKNPEVERELLTGISQLDSICIEIKKDLKDNIANQEVIQALIQNYRLKIRLLEEMLSVMKENEDNNEKKLHNEL